MPSIFFEDCKVENQDEKVGNFLLETIPHFFLNERHSHEFLFVEHGDGGYIFDEGLLGSKILPVLVHGDPAFLCGLFGSSQFHLFRVGGEVDSRVSNNIFLILSKHDRYKFFIFAAIKMHVMENSLREGLEVGVEGRIFDEVKVDECLF